MTTAGGAGARSKRQPQGALKSGSYSPEKVAAGAGIHYQAQHHQHVRQKSDQVVGGIATAVAINPLSNKNIILYSSPPDLQ